MQKLANSTERLLIDQRVADSVENRLLAAKVGKTKNTTTVKWYKRK